MWQSEYSGKSKITMNTGAFRHARGQFAILEINIFFKKARSMGLVITSVGPTYLGTQPSGFFFNFFRPALSMAHELSATGKKGNHHGKGEDKETVCWAPSLLLTELLINITGFIWKVWGPPCHGFVFFLLLHCLTFHFPSEQAGAGYSSCPRWVTPPE